MFVGNEFTESCIYIKDCTFPNNSFLFFLGSNQAIYGQIYKNQMMTS